MSRGGGERRGTATFIQEEDSVEDGKASLRKL
jgi:hypothetical protein